MNCFRSGLTGLALIAILPATAAMAGNADPENAKACNEAEVIAMLGASGKAADLYLDCAKVAGQTPFKVARSRFKRFEMLIQMNKPDLAEAELTALTSPPVSDYPVFTNTPTGVIVIGNVRSIGATQVDLLSARANFRLAAKDFPAALALADRAIAATGYDPALILDVAPAFEVRAKLAYLEKKSDAMVKLAVRAYIRGSRDPWTQSVIKALPAETQAAIETRRKRLHDEVGGYAYAISPQGQVGQKPEDLVRAIKDARAAVADLEAFEQSNLGPL